MEIVFFFFPLSFVTGNNARLKRRWNARVFRPRGNTRVVSKPERARRPRGAARKSKIYLLRDNRRSNNNSENISTINSNNNSDNNNDNYCQLL